MLLNLVPVQTWSFALAKIPDFELDWTYSGSQFNEVRLDELRTPLVSGCLSFNPCPPY